MNFEPEMPELTDERRRKLVKYYEGYVKKAIAQLDEWYPDGKLDPVPVKRAHESFVDGLTKVAIEIGYERWPWLAAAYGFYVVGVKAPEKIDIEANADSIAARAWDRFVEYALPSIDGLYPDGVIVDFRKDHENSCRRVTFYAKKLGYPTWGDLLVAAGYDVRDTFRSRDALDIDEINRELDELAACYKDNPAPTVQQVIEEADSRQLRALDRYGACNRLFGMTMAELFEQRGIIKAKRLSFSDEEQLQALDALKARYADAQEKPKTLSELREANEDLGDVIDYMGSGGSCTSRVFGVTLAKYLKSIGVLASKRSQSSGIDAEACEAIVNRLKEKYAHAIRPRNATALKEENEEYALHAKEVNKWIKETYGQSFPEFVKEQQLISAVGRPDSVPRPSDEEIRAFYDKIDLDGVLSAVESLPGDAVVHFQSDVTGNEWQDQSKNFEMLRAGDYIAIELLEGWYAGAVFCGYELGPINYSDRIEHHIEDRLEDAEAGLLVGDRVYARITQIAGGQKEPRAVLDVFYAKSSEGVNIVNDVLLSRDGKKALLNTRPSGEWTQTGGSSDDDCDQWAEVSFADPFDSAFDFAPKTFSVDSLTFGEGKRVSGPEFSVAVPDGWRVFCAREEGDRPFRAYADRTVLWDDIDEGEYTYDGLFYCPVPGTTNEDVKAALQEHGIDEFVRAFRRFAYDGDANPVAARIKRFDIVRGKNCYVMVADDRPYDEGYCVQIWPCTPFSSDYVRLNCPNQSSDDADAAFDKALEIAKSVEVAHPLVCDVSAAVEKCASKIVGADEFVQAAAGLVTAIDMARGLERKAVDQRFLREAKQKVASGGLSIEQIKDWNRHVILDYYSDFSERVIHYLFELMDAYAFQKESVASKDELQKMVGIIDQAMTLFDFRLTDDNPSEQAAIDALGNVRKPADWPRLRAAIDAEMRALGMEAPEGDDDPDGPDGPDGPGGPGGPVESGAALVPEPENAPEAERRPDGGEQGVESRGKGPCRQIDQALFAITMLSGDWIWFNPTQIIWDGEHHACTGADINAERASEFDAFLADEFPGCFASMFEARSFFAKLARELERDEALRVPREMVAPGLREALREGDLTGLTLLNFAACGSAIMLQRRGDQYLLIYDLRLGNGIPGFFDLCARMVWDLRSMNPAGEGALEVEPFTLVFAGSRNIDADEFFGEVRESVPGAQQSPMVLQIYEEPVVRVYASGPEDASPVNDGAGEQPEPVEEPDPGAQPERAEELEFPIEGPALGLIASDLPGQLVDCLAMCLRNVVGFDFFGATFDWLREVSLTEFDAGECEAVCRLAVQALRAQAFKGADTEDLELMQLEAESLIVDLNSVHGFDLQGSLLLEAQKSSAEELAIGRGRQVAGTHLVDALSQVYWSAATQLVDVLIEVVYAKSKAEYEKDFESWKEKGEELREVSDSARARMEEAESEHLYALNRERGLRKKADELADDIFEVVRVEKDIDCQIIAVAHSDALIAKKEEELAALKPWSLIQKGKLKEEIEDEKRRRERLVFRLDQLRDRRAARMNSFGKDSLTLERLRSLKEDAEGELALASEETARCASLHAEAEENVNEAKRAVNRHLLMGPDERTYPHRNLKQLLWRPVVSVG